VVSPGLPITFGPGLALAKPLKLTGWFSTSYNTSKLRLISAPPGHPGHALVSYKDIPNFWATLRLFSPVNTTIGIHLMNTPTGFCLSPQVALLATEG
jgi:hypothetical protein